MTLKTWPRSHGLAWSLVGCMVGAAAQAPLADVAAGTVATPAAPHRADCATATDQANAADLKAFNAQAGKADVALLAPLVESAAAAWQQAVESCDARARERAQRNLEDSRKMRAALGESPADLQVCEATQKDATAMQRLARRAVDERRWPDAVALFRKTEGFWELAGERCSGPRQAAAAKLREQAAVDGFNAGACDPLAVKLRQSAEQFRAAAGQLPAAERRQRSQALETRWRDLAQQCQGGAQGIALVEADLLLNEREPPWAAALAAAPARAAPTPTATLGAALAPPPGPAPAAAAGRPPMPSPASSPEPAGNSLPPTGLTAGALPTSPTGAGPVAAPFVAGAAAVDGIDVTLADQTRLQGRLTRDNDSQSYSGTGRIAWANGDLYQGEVRHGRGHGRGEFTWPSGQTFRGDWVDGHAQGRGVMRFVNGDVYDGPVEDGVPVGVGSMAYASGDRYEGGFAAGVPQGEGVYTWRSGQRCQCTWVAGQATGPGQMLMANGDRYTGPLLEGRPHGRGEMRYASGDSYQGGFDRGVSDGQGSYMWKNGDRYVGGWRQGTKEGTGTMVWASGERFEGEFRADVRVEPPR